MIVLDTHVLVWIAQGDGRLGKVARAVIDGESRQGILLIPAICIWEIGMLVAKNRLALAQDVAAWVEQVLGLRGMEIAPLLPSISLGSVRLPGRFHADPADRMIVATARHHQATLLTADGLILDYAADGHVMARDAQA